MKDEVYTILDHVNASEQQAFEKIIELSKTLTKEELLELFNATIYSLSVKNKSTISAIAEVNNIGLATDYAEATAESIKTIDKTADQILYKRNPIEMTVSENGLPGNKLM